ncbi:hypothetical protein NDU88_005485 [Pleurodeles waltl]|uniref:Uncharacterized protein n=1 Tax=Pleurodeles waltl TaxID=8319 RepID=A0AAV7TX95_PLEWA|nr:hypothetical protein NDU88_005485 [Pleurodeles waltl]
MVVHLYDREVKWLRRLRYSRAPQGHPSSWTQKNRRLKKTPRPERKKPLLGGAERRRNRSRQKPLKTSADPGELCEGAVTLQEKRGLSRYGVRYKGKRAGGGRYGKGRGRENKGHGTGSTGRKGKQRGTARGALGRRKKTGEREKDKDSEESYICTLTYNINPKSRKGKTRKKGSL